MLVKVAISDCAELEAIFSGNEETEKGLYITEAYLPKLESLRISDCNKLKFILSFMINAATLMLPQLRTLSILKSSQLEEIFRCSNIEDHDIDSEMKIMFPNLKNVALLWLPRLVNVCQVFKLQTREFCRVDVYDCPQFMPILGATMMWTKDGRLVRMYKLKCSQLNNNEALNLPLSVLNVGEVDIQSPKVDHEFEVIGDDDEEETKDLKLLLEQEMLGGLAPTQVLSFQYLHSLTMIGCKKLKFLFSVSTIVHNGLPKLSSLTLSNCEELEVIFEHSSKDEANVSEKILLSSLRNIWLENLPNLDNLCRGIQIQVQLSDITIRNCPKFLDSSLGPVLQQMGTVLVSTERSDLQTTADVEERLSMHDEKGIILTSRVECLRLWDLANLLCVWEGPSFISFQNLFWLSVIKCKKLKCLFPRTVMRGLPCLKILDIANCKELEEIIMSSEREEEEPLFPNASSSSLICFPQLEWLRVDGCG